VETRDVAREAIPAAEAGAPIFEANCALCHSLTSEVKVGPGLAGMFNKDVLPDGNPLDDQNLKQWILTGGGSMPGVSLADEDLELLVSFLRTEVGEWTASAEPTRAAEAPLATAAGEDAFATHCSTCHGVTSQATVGPGLAGLFEKDTLPDGSVLNDANLAQWILRGGGTMPGVPVPDGELEALIAYLKDATR
jgi:mono/diheme cytochrome c family protein